MGATHFTTLFPVSYLDEFFEKTYLPRRLIGCSDSCKVKYRRHIRWLTERLHRRAEVADLTDQNIADLMQWRASLGKSPGTVNSIQEQLSALGRFAALKGHLAVAPDVSPMKEYRRTPTAWNADELDRLFAAAKEQPGWILDVYACDWWTALLSVLWDCGARIGAVLKVKPEDIDLSRRTLTLRAENQKQGEDQEFELHPDTIEALRKIKYTDRKFVFRWHRDLRLLWRDYTRILKRAGLPHGRRDKFHRIRRSVASWYKREGGDATALLGHSSPAVTRAYLDPTIVGFQSPSAVLRRPNADQKAG
jgi:integrase